MLDRLALRGVEVAHQVVDGRLTLRGALHPRVTGAVVSLAPGGCHGSAHHVGSARDGRCARPGDDPRPVSRTIGGRVDVLGGQRGVGQAGQQVVQQHPRILGVRYDTRPMPGAAPGVGQRTLTLTRAAQVRPAAFATDTDIQYFLPFFSPLMVHERFVGPTLQVPATFAPFFALVSACTR